MMFFFFYLVLDETKALAPLAFMRVDLSAQPPVKKRKKKKNVFKNVKIWTVCEPPGVDSCFSIGPRCMATSDCNQRYGAEPPVVSL